MRVRSRRDFVRVLAAGGAFSVVGLPLVLHGCDPGGDPLGPGDDDAAPGARNRLRLPAAVSPLDITLTAAVGIADIGGGTQSPAWMLNGALPSPLLRLRRGDPFRLTMQNQLPHDLILHWHGITPPETMDGHPRFAVSTGSSYAYDFTVEDRASAYWYHSHTHMHSGEHTYRGIAGFVIVNDAEEEALGLPSGARELPIILQDRLLDSQGLLIYSNVGPARMAGVMGPEPFGNGVRRPFVEVDSALYRLRLLNGANARIFRLGRGDGAPLILIGNDGGLMPAPQSLGSIDLAPAERADVLLDLRSLHAGDTMMLRSLPFSIPGGMGFMGGANLQGQPLDLVEFRVTRTVDDPTAIPTALPSVDLPDPADSVGARTFTFQSLMMSHTINGRTFEMARIDERVPFDTTETWNFVNDSSLPHPVHLHATQFRVVSRSGGRGQVMPWEAGRKDTVLVYPFETVQVAVRFTKERGLFLLHCHNLEHEDMAMMQNVLVE